MFIFGRIIYRKYIFPCDPVQKICIPHLANVSMNVVVSPDYIDTRLDDVKVGNMMLKVHYYHDREKS
jgi:hypothetical protein